MFREEVVEVLCRLRVVLIVPFVLGERRVLVEGRGEEGRVVVG